MWKEGFRNRPMSYAKLKSKYDILQKMSFPDSEQSEELAEWVFDLMEVDAYYSQLALAVIEAKDYGLCQDADLLKVKGIKFWLESFKKISGNDRPNVAYAKMYINTLEKLVETLAAGE